MSGRFYTPRLPASRFGSTLQHRQPQFVRPLPQPTFKNHFSASTRLRQEQLEHVNLSKPFLPTGGRSSDTLKHKPGSRQLDDPYQSRVASRVHLRTRPHPVIWGDWPGPLNVGDLHSYSENGFLQVEHLLSGSEIANLDSELNSLLADPAFRSNPRCVIELSSEEVRSIFEIHKLSPTVGALLRSRKLATMARQILGSDVYVHQSRINFKPAFAGKGFYWHSDFETWHAEDGMPLPRALSFSISLTDNSHANGPLMVIAGSHKTFVSCVGATPDNHHLQSLREQEIGVADRESLALLAAEASGIKVVTGPPGSAVLFDSNCMHGSNDNITPFGRCNLFVVFNSVENALGAPYYARTRRPEYIAARDFTPV